MFQVSVRQHFDAAHYLRGYKGKCENLHGHRFEVVARVDAEKLDDKGLAFDFVELKDCVREITGKLDHTCINDLPYFSKNNASSENIALLIFNGLAERLKGKPVKLASVEVWESPENCITYTP